MLHRLPSPPLLPPLLPAHLSSSSSSPASPSPLSSSLSSSSLSSSVRCSISHRCVESHNMSLLALSPEEDSSDAQARFNSCLPINLVSTRSFGWLSFELAPICLHLPGTELSESTTGFPFRKLALPRGFRTLCRAVAESTPESTQSPVPKKPFLAGPEQACLVFLASDGQAAVLESL